MKTGKSVGDVAARTAPEELGGRRRARPGDGIEVLRAGLLDPEEVLAAEDELLLRIGEVRDGVEDVGLRECVRSERTMGTKRDEPSAMS